jgi:hypothetical protein
MPTGRPTKYSEDMQAQADAYVDGGYESCNDAVPSTSGMAFELGVSRQTLYDWADKHSAFLDTLDRCSQIQERRALSGGLRNEMNASIVKLLLANHGYSDKQQHEHSGPDGSPMQTVVVLPSKDEQ